MSILVWPNMSRDEYIAAYRIDEEVEEVVKCECGCPISCTGWKVIPKDIPELVTLKKENS